MKTLIALDSPIYLRRMARELNALEDGFYYDGQRFNRARYSGGWLSISRPHEDGDPNHTAGTGVKNCAHAVFSDAYGRTVSASRKAP